MLHQIGIRSVQRGQEYMRPGVLALVGYGMLRSTLRGGYCLRVLPLCPRQ